MCDLALIMAIKGTHIPVIETLLMRGGNIRETFDNGTTTVELARTLVLEKKTPEREEVSVFPSDYINLYDALTVDVA